MADWVSCCPAAFLSLCICFAAQVPSVFAQQLELDSATVQGYEGTIQPFLTKYCLDCHSGSEPEAGVPLDHFQDLHAAVGDRQLWDRVRENVAARIMPPEGSEQPTAEEVQALSSWIESTFSKIDCQLKDPGRVTIRRLNRAEYNNTIRDLVGIDFKPAADFPSDDVGYGFDNIGDVLSLPPLLLEKYLAAAEQVATKAITTGTVEEAPRVEFTGDKLRREGSGGENDGWSLLASSGELFVSHNFPSDGQYVIRCRTYGDQAGKEAVKIAIKLDGSDILNADVFAKNADEAETHEHSREIKAGEHRIAVAFLNDYYNEKARNPRRRDRNLWIKGIEVIGPVGFHPETLPETHKRIVFCRPSADAQGEQLQNESTECAKQILQKFASRAFRRPVTPDELNRLVSFVRLAQDEGESFDGGIRLAIQAILVSPNFLFRIELDQQPNADGAYAIDDYQLASRLSYFLWSSMPDDELFALAAGGQLKNPDVLEAQVRRMLQDPRAKSIVDNFATQWLQIRSLRNITPDKELFPSFDEGLRTAMQTETELYFESIIKEDRSLLDLLDSDYTFLNEQLAKHYGIDGVQGPEFRRVALHSGQRGGVLTQASVLTVTSNPTRTSPVKRGKWILEALFGTPPPPPPPDAGELSEEEGAVLSGSVRQRLEMHRAKPACASCHSRMDPLGFGLENFDAIGAWRTQDGNFPVDPVGTLPDGKTFSGPAELKKTLREKQQLFLKNITAKMLTYALGRGVESYDNCVVQEISQKLAHDNYKFSRLVLEIVKSEPFQMRKAVRMDSPE